jgi:hypothetical protein
MTNYNTPEVALLGNANQVIQGEKSGSGETSQHNPFDCEFED